MRKKYQDITILHSVRVIKMSTHALGVYLHELHII